VVLSSVEAHTTVAGIPAKIVGVPQNEEPSLSMDQGMKPTGSYRA
jgi:serine O-acetyltransferase